MASKPLRAIAVIPARGGSKRLPGKALLHFLGKPMISHTIEAAIESGCFEKITVSSDDDDILRISAKYGATPYKRSDSLADDLTTTTPVLLDVMENEAADGDQWDVLACLYATAPLRTSLDIRNVVGLIEPGQCDFAMAVCGSDRPAHQVLRQNENGVLEPVFADLVGVNSQDADKYLYGNGSTYAVSVPAFQNAKSLYGPGLRGYEMPLSRSVDLNTEDDLALLNFYADQAKQL